MDAIVTKYHGSTNTKGARISASVSTKRVYVPYPYEHDGWRAHAVAARALLVAVGIDQETKMAVGEIAQGYVFVCEYWTNSTGSK